MSRLTVISDPGVDDLVALALLDKLTKRQPKILVSTFGNNAADITSENAKSFVASVHGDWSYRAGAPLPLSGKVNERWLDGTQGTDGLWGCRPESRETIIADSGEDSSRVISLAPLTESSKIMQARPIKELTIMGGLFASVRDGKQLAELNIRLDIPAAKWVFENCKDCNVTLIPADVAENVRWTKEDIAAISESNETNRWLKRLLLAGYKNGRYNTGNDFILYDPLAIYLAYNPQLALWRRSGVAVIDEGESAGCTVLSDNNPLCTIATDLKEPDTIAQQIFSALFEDYDGRA